MNKEVQVSILCTTYKQEKYIREALEGFVSQNTSFKYEVIIHDDASDDLTPEIIGEYAQKHSEIVFPILQKNNQYSQGVDILFGIMMPRAQGKYIALCDGDDYWIDNSKLQLQFECLENNKDYSACVHNTEEHNMKNKKTRIMYKSGQDRDVSAVSTMTQDEYSFHTSSIFFRKELAYNRPHFLELTSDFKDTPLSVHLALSGKIRFLDRIMSVYRRYTENSWTVQQKDLAKQIKHHKNVIKMFRAIDEQTTHEYTKVIDELILKREYMLEEARGNYAVLKKDPFIDIYNQMAGNYKIKLFIKQYLHFIYLLYRKCII